MTEGNPPPRDPLAKAVDWTWALDTSFGLVEFKNRHLASGLQWPLKLMGRAPWDWPGVIVNSDGFRALKDALLERRPVDGNEIAMRDPRGRLRHLALWGEPTIEADGSFRGYRGTGREITALRRSQALLALEHAVTRSLAEASTSRKILQAVMREVCEAEQWETCGYFRVEDELGTTRLIAGWAGPGMAREAADYYHQTNVQLIPPGGMLSRVAQSGQPLWVRALRQSQTTWAERVRSTGERATLFCPALVDGRVHGVFAFASREAREPDELLLRTMRVIGEQTGQFLQRKQAEQALRESEERFRAMTELSADWYWEADADLVLTRIDGQFAGELRPSDCSHVVGRPLPGADLILQRRPEASGDDKASAGRWRFRDLHATHRCADGVERHISVSGQAVVDPRGRLTGYRGVARDVTAVKRAEDARLEAARLQAEHQSLIEANRLKALFLTHMSHELRTPLNAVLGFAHLMRRRSMQADDPKLERYADRIEVSGQTLLRLIEQLLDHSSLEAGKFAFRPQPISVRALVQEVLGAVDGDVRRKRQTVRTECDDGADAVIVDPASLRQVIWAYLGNAIAFAPEGGQIVVRSLADGPDRFRIEVQDDGVGIAASELPKLFTAFHQGSTGLSRNHEGAGISLALARGLIEGQGGSVGAISEAGRGSTFHLVLPRDCRPGYGSPR